jgi:hypothetical protein
MSNPTEGICEICDGQECGDRHEPMYDDIEALFVDLEFDLEQWTAENAPDPAQVATALRDYMIQASILANARGES